MKILVYETNFSSSGIDYPIKDALSDLGHEVVMFDWLQYYFTYKNSSLFNRLKNRFLKAYINHQINKDLVDVVKKGKYDFFLVMRGEHIYPDTIDIVKCYVKFIVNWNTDDLFNRLNSSKYILSSIDKYDIHFTPRMHLKDEYIAKGAKEIKRVNWYFKAELAILKYPDVNSFESDIRFIGSMSKYRRNFLNHLSDLNCEVYGWGWKKVNSKVSSNSFSLHSPVGQKRMIELFKTTKINVNIMTLENRDKTNLRLFDIPSVGGFQLCERTDEVIDIFREDKEIVCFSSGEELRDKCLFYINNDRLRNQIAKAGFERVIKGNFTLKDSVGQILKEIPLQ
jgi:spore maturation protein CgeB